MLAEHKTQISPLQGAVGCGNNSSAHDEPPPSYDNLINASSHRTTPEKNQSTTITSQHDLREPPPEYVNPNRPQKEHQSHTCQRPASTGVPASVLLSIMGPPPEPETRTFWQRWRDGRQIARERRDDKTLRRTDMTSSRRWNVDGIPIHQRK